MACTIDFRFLDEGLGGPNNKRKRRSDDDQSNNANIDASMDIDAGEEGCAPSSKRQAVASSENPDKPLYGRPTYDGVIAGKVSGRKWKQARKHRTSSLQVSLKGTTFEQRAREKEIKRAYKERMNELKEGIRLNKIEKRKKREEREKLKKDNILRSGTKLQVITNPKTLQKISKSKDKKRLKVVPDDIFLKKKNNNNKKEK